MDSNQWIWKDILGFADSWQKKMCYALLLTMNIYVVEYKWIWFFVRTP